MKSKLGISVGLLAALVFMLVLTGNLVAAVVVAGYVLICEENDWLKYAVVKAIAVYLVIAFAIYVLNLVPGCLGWLNDFIDIFADRFNYSVVSNIISVCTGALSLIRTVLLLILGVKALRQGTINVPVVDSVINK